ncbi:hypothetical protein BDN70DRAFT_878162 [Pholiota conissans]|uniref:Uncharacterized protein n=1 Tax=Pholiota conissans TaxID=109636 RepID=A0A9P6CU14_9AGAR|nr:hypothetical protein BDN70DRAFT_878162 [Pholiota conissans]
MGYSNSLLPSQRAEARANTTPTTVLEGPASSATRETDDDGTELPTNSKAFTSTLSTLNSSLDAQSVKSAYTARHSLKLDASGAQAQPSRRVSVTASSALPKSRDALTHDSTCTSLKKRKARQGDDFGPRDKRKAPNSRKRSRRGDSPATLPEKPPHDPQFEIEIDSYLALFEGIREDNKEFVALSNRQKFVRFLDILKHTAQLYERVIEDPAPSQETWDLVNIITKSRFMADVCDTVADIEAYKEHMQQPGATWDNWAVGDDEVSERRRANTKGYVLPWDLEQTATPQ